jgi:hypothetical protein
MDHFFKIVIFWLFIFKVGDSSNPLDKIIIELAQKVNEYQVLKPLNSSPPFHWYEKKGKNKLTSPYKN